MAAHQSILPVLSLICNMLFPHAYASPTELTPRKSTSVDPYIVCDVPPPLSFPPNYPSYWYPTTLALCSALNGAFRNVGCVCHSSSSDSLECNEDIADRTLFNYRVASTSMQNSALQPLSSFCRDSCFCSDTNTAARARNPAINRLPGVINVPYDPDGPNPFAGVRTRPYEVQANATANAQSGTGSNRWANQCGTNCTSKADCAGGGADCTCLAAQKGTFQPGVGTVAFVAACIVSMAKSGGVSGGRGGGGKRDVKGTVDNDIWGCPCNSSYVSRSCCGISDGLVWEAPELKLGELIR